MGGGCRQLGQVRHLDWVWHWEWITRSLTSGSHLNYKALCHTEIKHVSPQQHGTTAMVKSPNKTSKDVLPSVWKQTAVPRLKSMAKHKTHVKRLVTRTAVTVQHQREEFHVTRVKSLLILSIKPLVLETLIVSRILPKTRFKTVLKGNNIVQPN